MNMGRLLRGVIVMLVSLGFLASSLAYAEDIICVDLFEVFSKYKKTEDYDKLLEEKQNKKEEELEKEKKELDKLKEQLKLIKESEREVKKKEIEEKTSEFNDLRRQALLDLKKERDTRMKEILEDIQAAIEKYAEKNKVKIVLKKSAVSFVDSKLDKTKDIINIINKEYKK
ncbi:MAG: hypothetical protein DRP80_00200 [Candidatus Omnitrophota bacterium]|nr:MAG: hypothetical protein DRP69_00960 [Candidatus Omnitrophota bacterium]RKY45009.1 MAG: hypothetical protein DRP80_00200 [Candidatus Omnitrophota bacterium]